MTDTIRFPVPSGSPESTEIVTLMSAVTQLRYGGEATYASIIGLKTMTNATESPFLDLVIEFTADKALIIGDGSASRAIGLFGQIGVGATGRALLGVLGYTIAPGFMPQISIIQDAAGNIVGQSQIIQAEAAYDRLSVGGIAGDIPFDAAQLLTVKIRPLRIRSYVG